MAPPDVAQKHLSVIQSDLVPDLGCGKKMQLSVCGGAVRRGQAEDPDATRDESVTHSA